MENYCRAYPDVNFRSYVVLAPKDFGGRVGGTSAPGTESLARGEAIAEPEIGNFDVHLGVEEQILGLEIAMRDSFGVTVLHGRQNLGESRACPRLAHPPVTSYVIENFASVRVLADLWGKINNNELSR